MSNLQISLFGQFRIRRDGRDLDGFDVLKVQELLSYLLLHAGRPQVRELLASRLWGGHCTTSRSKAYLRKALWRLQSALRTEAGAGAENLITASGDSIRLHRISSVELDVAVFEEAYADARGVPGHGLSSQSVHALKRAVRLYDGDLLANWYVDWCTGPRARLKQIYLILLDKLTQWCEVHGQYEEGLEYGAATLEHDSARERTHRQLMRLHVLAGYRTAALRQYDACARILREELDVAPAQRTVELYDQIRSDRFDRRSVRAEWETGESARRSSGDQEVPPGADPADVRDALRILEVRLQEMQHQLETVLSASRLSAGPDD
jgi:DNA-binding SARP family transcriptional activator